MKTITITDIRNLNPCYDPTEFLPEDWSGTVQDILCLEHVPARNRLWVVTHTQFLGVRILQEFELACARMCEQNSPDARVKACNDTVEAFLDGMATRDELIAAKSAAMSAADAATWYATESAAEAAVRYAAIAAEFAARSAEDGTYSAWATAKEEEQCTLLLHIIEAFK